MVLISVMRTSRTLPLLIEHGEFGVSVLGEDAGAVSSTVASRAPDKFSRVPLDFSERGLPLVHGALAWFDCSVNRVVEAGDHVLVLGDVIEAGPAENESRPLLFYRSAYESLSKKPTQRVHSPQKEESIRPVRERAMAAACATAGFSLDDWF